MKTSYGRTPVRDYNTVLYITTSEFNVWKSFSSKLTTSSVHCYIAIMGVNELDKKEEKAAVLAAWIHSRRRLSKMPKLLQTIAPHVLSSIYILRNVSEK